MRAPAEILAGSRLDGHTLSMGCRRCPLLAACGGYTRASGAWSCMDLCDGCDPAICDKVCLKKPARFVEDLLEVGGFGFRGIPELLQPPAAALPRYIPTIQHGSERSEDLSVPWAAVPMSRFVRFQDGQYGPSVATPGELRRLFRLSPTTRVLLLGVGKDRAIERYWGWRGMHDTPRSLSALDFSAAVVPNYSFFLEDPRPQHLFNRKRSLICADEFSRAGLPAVPCLQAVAPSDWTYWQGFLEAHEEVSVVAKEFQTGLASRERGLIAIDGLARVQDRIRRKLHVVAVGGGRYAPELAAHFNGYTVIDSVPFMKAAHRRRAGALDRRVHWIPMADGDVAEMLTHNIVRWSAWLAARARGGVLEAARATTGRIERPSSTSLSLQL